MIPQLTNLEATRWSLSPQAHVPCPQPKGKGREGPAPHSPDLVSPLRAAGIYLAHTLVQVLVLPRRRPFLLHPALPNPSLTPGIQGLKLKRLCVFHRRYPDRTQ